MSALTARLSPIVSRETFATGLDRVFQLVLLWGSTYYLCLFLALTKQTSSIWPVASSGERLGDAVSVDDVESPFAVSLCSGILLSLSIRYYQSVVFRLCCTAIFIYWAFYSREYVSLVCDVFDELLHFERALGGESSWDGQHWSLYIADTVIRHILTWCFRFAFPAYWWLPAVIFCLWKFALFPRLRQVLLHRVIAKLARRSRNIPKWICYLIERACLSIAYVFDYSIIRAMMGWFWLVCFEIVTRVPSSTMVMLMYGSLRICFTPDVDTFFVAGLLLYWRLIQLPKLAVYPHTSAPDYTYTPLKSSGDIRLLLLFPRLAFQPISCILFRCPDIKYLLYEAVSYRWDSKNETEEIFVNGCRKKVTKSAFEVLASTSSLFFPKLLWIDAICIDQSNLAEKSKQVLLMDKIYRSAFLTTMFLGQTSLEEDKHLKDRCMLPFRYEGINPNNGETRNLFEGARMAFNLLNGFRVLRKPIKKHELRISESYEKFLALKPTEREWRALLEMMQHPIFERIWIVQEIVLSSRLQVRYGDEVMQWEHFASVIEVLEHPNERPLLLWLEYKYQIKLQHRWHTSLSNICRMAKLREKWHNRINVLRLDNVLKESFFFKATDARDLVYGMMSLCKHPLPVSYENVSAAEVFKAAAEELIRRGSFDAITHAAGVGNRLEPNMEVGMLPSWVPDWTLAAKSRDLARFKIFARYIDLVERHNSPLKPAVELKGDGRLIFSGKFIGVVDKLGPVIFDRTVQEANGALEAMVQLVRNYDSCWRLVEDSIQIMRPYPHAAGISLREAFRRTMIACGGPVSVKSIHRAFKPVLQTFPEWEAKLDFFRDRTDRSFSTDRHEIFEMLQSTSWIAEIIKKECGGRRFFISKEGHIGLCPPYTRPGDLLYDVPGIVPPLLLRYHGLDSKVPGAVEGSEKVYQLVGECYVHGLMDQYTQSLGTKGNKVEIV